MPRILSNVHNLPEPIFRAVEFESYEKRGHISVTTLIDSPKINYLKSTFDFYEDISDMIWALRGQALHHILERTAIQLQKKDESIGIQPRYLSEFKMSYDFEEEGKDTVVITGTADLVHMANPSVLYDYKDCSYYKISGCDKTIDTDTGTVVYKPRNKECLDWIKQLNIYAFFLRKKYNIIVQKIRVIALLKDWSRRDMFKEGYPSAPIVVVDIPIYSDDVIEGYVRNRINLHREHYILASKHGADSIPECSPEERWKKFDTYKIYSSSESSKSMKNFELIGSDDEKKAIEIAAHHYYNNVKLKNKDAKLVLVNGLDGRCHDYCSVNVHCHYYKNIVKSR